MSRKVEVSSACVGRIVNDLCANGVCVRGVRKEGRRFCFCTDTRCMGAVRAYMERRCIDYCVQPKGVGRIGAFAARHWAMWVALAVVGVALALCFLMVWDVRVQCVEALEPAVSAVVAPSRYHWRWQVDCADLKQQLTALDGVALASVYRRGTTLVAEVKEELPKAQVNAPAVAPIVAVCDCIVSRIVVERGRAMVQEGQSVRKGDVLIAPEYLLDKNEMITAPGEAIGEVYGYVYPMVAVTYNERTFTTRTTGQSATYATLSVVGQTFGQPLPSPYRLYDTVTQVVRLQGWLGVDVVRTTYTELEQIEVFRPWEQAKEEILAECYAQIVADVKNSVQIVRKWCIINNTGSVYSVRAYAQVEQQVGEALP